ncbi:MAG: LysM peptidoglycan-binding domain-containing protein, partial [Anaerolineae bacterium]|nr:LysM peptidoglycan-binding domain-containing protein [Anaerolineae bacterium]
QMNGVSCSDLGANSACYGNQRVQSEFRLFTEPPQFSKPGDVAALDRFQAISAAPLDMTRQEYGVAVLSMEARVPGTLVGDLVTFILYGDSHLNDDLNGGTMSVVNSNVRELPAFYFYTGVGLTDQCLDLPEGDLPDGGILLQSPEGVEVAFTANGAQIEIGSTILLQASPAQKMTVTVLEGHATVSVPGYGTQQTALSLQAIDIPLGGVDGLQAVGAPSIPYPVATRNLGLSTVCRLIAWAGLNSPCTAQNTIQPTASPSPLPTLAPTETATLPPAPTMTPFVAAPPCAVQTSIGWQRYFVQPGDTLYALARRTNTTAQMIAEVNCIGLNDPIFAGAPLYLPFIPAAIVPTSTPVIPTETPGRVGVFPLVITPTDTLLPPMMHVDFTMAGGATYDSQTGRYVAYADACNHGIVFVTFENRSYGGNGQYTWNFGDGSSSQETNPTWRYVMGYGDSYIYTVTLIAYSDSGSPTTYSQQLVVIGTSCQVPLKSLG